MMEYETMIVLMIGLSFLSIISLKIVKNYNASEVTKNNNSQLIQQQRLIYEKNIDSLEQSNKNYKYKIRHMRENYDIDYDDIDENEVNEENFKLSDLAKTIYPKLPPSLSKIIDKEEFQNAVVKTVEKKPDIINTFFEKFIKKDDNTEKTNKLSESYL